MLLARSDTRASNMDTLSSVFDWFIDTYAWVESWRGLLAWAVLAGLLALICLAADPRTAWLLPKRVSDWLDRATRGDADHD